MASTQRPRELIPKSSSQERGRRRRSSVEKKTTTSGTRDDYCETKQQGRRRRRRRRRTRRKHQPHTRRARRSQLTTQRRTQKTTRSRRQSVAECPSSLAKHAHAPPIKVSTTLSPSPVHKLAALIKHYRASATLLHRIISARGHTGVGNRIPLQASVSPRREHK